MKANKFRSKLQTELTDNYNIYQMIENKAGKLNHGSQQLKYQEYLYIMFNGKISMPKIAYFKNKKYKNQQPLLRRTFLVEDGLKLNQEVIGKAWRFQRASQKQIKVRSDLTIQEKSQQQMSQSKLDANLQENAINNQGNQQKNNLQTLNNPKQSVESPIKRQSRSLVSKNQQLSKIKQRIFQLQDLLTTTQAKMNTCRNQQQSAEYQKQYNKYFKQLTDIRNRKRIFKEKKLLKKLQEQVSAQVPQKIKNILIKLNEIKLQNARILHKSPQYSQRISKSQEVIRLSTIFNHYSKKQVKNINRYFSDLQKQQNKLKLQTFIKFCQDWNLNRIISMNRIINIFKARSKGNKYIDLLQFTQILSDIHNYQCIKQEKQITNQSISFYLQNYIVNEKKMNKILMNTLANQQVKQRGNSYQFKPKSHSGKYLKDIKDQLQMRKKTLDCLAGPQNVIKFHKNKSILKNDSVYRTIQNSRANSRNDRLQTETVYTNSMNPYNPMADSINSYAFRFKLKNTKNRIKTQGIIKEFKNAPQNKLNNLEQKNNESNGPDSLNRQNISNRQKSKIRYSRQIQPNIEQTQENITIQNILNTQKENQKIKNSQQKNKTKDLPFEGFDDLIDDEQDQYLSRHFLPTIQILKKAHKSIHY